MEDLHLYIFIAVCVMNVYSDDIYRHSHAGIVLLLKLMDTVRNAVSVKQLCV